MRQWLKPRSLLLHAAFLAIAAGCLMAAWWQIHRAMSGNTLSYLYSVEWPAFVVVAGIGWWQMFHDTPEDIAERRAFHERMRAASAEVVARTLPRSALAITVGSEPVVAGRILPRTRSSGELAQATAPAVPAVDGSLLPATRAVPDIAGEPDAAGGPDAVGLLDPEDEGGDPITDYNRYLAILAVRGKAKTWRNPHGT